MDAATQAAWDAGPYAKCLRDAQTAKDTASLSAADLWARVFHAPELWFDPEPLDYAIRPTEYAAFRNILGTCKGAAGLWQTWRDLQDAALYNDELDALARAVELATEQTARQNERRAIRNSQLPLPFAAVALAG